MSSLSGRIVLLGTGALAGNTLWDKDSAGQVLNSLKGFIPKVVEGGAVAGSDARLDQLSADVRAIMMSNRQGGTVVVSQGGSGMSKVLVYAIPAGAVYLYLKGYRLGDLSWVSRSSFAKAVESIGKAQEALGNSLATFREAVGKRLVEFQTEVELRFGELQQSHRQLENQVGVVQGSVAEVYSQVNGVDQRVQGLERKLDETQAQLAYTSKGIHLLCSVVSGSLGSGEGVAGELEEFSRYSPLMPRSQGAVAAAAEQQQLEDAPVMVERESPPLSGSAAALSLFGHKPVLSPMSKVST